MNTQLTSHSLNNFESPYVLAIVDVLELHNAFSDEVCSVQIGERKVDVEPTTDGFTVTYDMGLVPYERNPVVFTMVEREEDFRVENISMMWVARLGSQED